MTRPKGKVLTQAEYQQRVNAARAAAARRRGTGRGRQQPQGRTGPTNSTAGLGNSKSQGYVNTDNARNTFRSNGISGADVNQRKDPNSGFMIFSGKDQGSHAKFVNSIKGMGFMVSIGADGSGIAINRAGQAIRIGAPGNRQQNYRQRPQRRWTQRRGN